MAESGDDEGQGFKVTDRRSSADAPATEPRESEAPDSDADSDMEAFEEAAGARSLGAAPPADFNTLVLSLSTSALMHLGLLAEPDGTPMPKNLPLARHSIDLLSMLEQKTRGNLTGEEETLLGQVLYDLRMHFVSVAKA